MLPGHLLDGHCERVDNAARRCICTALVETPGHSLTCRSRRRWMGLRGDVYERAGFLLAFRSACAAIGR